MSKKRCRKCPDFEAPGFYQDRELFNKHESLLRDAEEAGRLRWIEKPSWYKELLTKDMPAGGEAYFKCRRCRAVWHVLLPDMAFSGYIEQIR